MHSLTAILVALTSCGHFVTCARHDVTVDGHAVAAAMQVRATDSVVLRVRDGAGRAVPRARVFVDRSPYGSIRALPPTVVPPASTPTGVTDDDGMLQIAREDTPYAAATIVATGCAPRMLRLWGSDAIDPLESEVMEVGGAPPVTEVVLSPSARILGRVGRAPDGAAVRALVSGGSLLDVARARVDGWFPAADAAFVAPLATDGTFVLDTLPAGAVMRLDLVVGDEVLSCVPECIALVPGEARRVEWTVGDGAALECLVRDERGAPIRAARVQLSASSCGGWSSAYDAWGGAKIRSTDAAGRVVFEDVLPGRWTVALERPRLPAQRRAGSKWPETDVTVDVVGAETQTVELTAFEARTISGVIVDPDGTPLEGVVHLTRMTAGIPASSSSIYKCAADGTFRSDLLAPGTYRVVGRREWPKERPFAPSEPVYVQAGDEGARIALRPGRSFELRALDEASRTPADAYFSVGCEGSGWGPLCLFQLAPTRQIRSVPPGRLVMIARTADGRVGATRIEGSAGDVAAVRECSPVEVRVRAGGMLHVRYRGSVPLLLCEVAFDGVLVDEFSVVSGADVRLAFPPGRGTLHWRVDSGARGEAGTARKGQRELTFVTGDTVSIDLEL
jgi:hypothetical protein